MDVRFDGPSEGDAADNDEDGREEVPTELVQMNLTGHSPVGPVQVSLRSDIPSTGQIEEQSNRTPGTLDVPPFIRGYNQALKQPHEEPLGMQLNEMEARFRGFAFEGAAMGLAMLDLVSPWTRSRWRNFLSGSGSCHAYMLHVGAGWAAARLPWVRRRIVRHLEAYDPVLRWLVVDGYGFHQGYFYWPQYVEQHTRPAHLSGYALRAFDQGLGRSLWFVLGASVSRLQATIQSFSPSRRIVPR